MIERRRETRIRKNIQLPATHVELLRRLAEKHGVTESAAICTAITQWADREGITVDKEQK